MNVARNSDYCLNFSHGELLFNMLLLIMNSQDLKVAEFSLALYTVIIMYMNYRFWSVCVFFFLFRIQWCYREL